MKKPFITFIIPHYNKPAYMLRECIESVMSLELGDDEREIIIVDDGSIEKSEELVKSIGEDIVYLYQQNQGPSVARNRAMDIATGEYIQFLDSDDYLVSSNYNEVIRTIRKKRMDMLLFRYTTDTVVAKTIKETIPPEAITTCKGSEYLLNNNLRAACCLYIFRRELVNDLRFQPGIFHEDTLFTPLLIMRTKTFCDTTTKAYFYRQTEGSTMNSRNKQHVQKRLDNLNFVLHEFKKETKRLSGTEQMAMERCLHQEIMCYMFHILELTHSFCELRKRVIRLRDEGLFPMPLKKYTLKYWLFALFTRPLSLC